MNARRNEDHLAWAIALGVGVLTVLYRVAPYYWAAADPMWNMMPVGALALFAGTRLRSPWAVAIPLASMFVGDLLLIAPLKAMGWPTFTWGTPLIYLSFATYFLLGRVVGHLFPGPMVLPGAILGALAGGAQFFLVTNAAAWMVNLDGRYSPDLSGLFQSYLAAVPYHRGTLLSDLLFTVLIFGAYELFAAALPAPRVEGQPA